MTIKDLIDQFEIQGAYRIRYWDEITEEIVTVAEGHDFDCEYYDIDNKYLYMNITYMYAVDGILNIEVTE
jgi:hypothetical protein